MYEDDNVSVTVTLAEYRKLQGGAPLGVVATVAAVAFGIGVVLGVATLDEPKRPQPGVTTSVVAPTP